MADNGLRSLEREAAQTGTPESRLRYAHVLELRVGEKEQARDVYRGVLADTLPSGGELCDHGRLGWIRTGGEWVEFDEQTKQMKLFNIKYQNKGRGDAELKRYNFCWDLDHFEHEKRDDEENGVHYFVQRNAARLVNGRGDGKVVGDAGEFIVTGMFLDDVCALGFQPSEVTRGQGLLRESYGLWVGPSTKIVYGKNGKVVHNVGRVDEFDELFDLRGSDGYLEGLGEEGRRIAQAVLWTDEPVSEIDRVHKDLLDVENGSYIWRIQGSDERAVVLGRSGYDNGFDVDAGGVVIDYGRPVRLVVVQDAKNFSSGNRG